MRCAHNASVVGEGGEEGRGFGGRGRKAVDIDVVVLTSICCCCRSQFANRTNLNFVLMQGVARLNRTFHLSFLAAAVLYRTLFSLSVARWGGSELPLSTRMTRHPVASPLCATPCHVVSCPVISCHILSYPVTSCHILSCVRPALSLTVSSLCVYTMYDVRCACGSVAILLVTPNSWTQAICPSSGPALPCRIQTYKGPSPRLCPSCLATKD